MTMQPEAEAWMPNGFPPPSFVVETQRVSTFSTARGRWLAAAALLGAVLLLAGILMIAKGGDDTAVKTGPGTTVPSDDAATFPPSTALDPTATGAEATTGPTLPVGPNASVPGGAGGPRTTAAAPGPAAPGPAGPAPPGAAPGVLEAPGNATIPTVFTAKGTSSGTIGLKNTGQGPLSYTSRATAGLSAKPGSGSIASGASVTVTLTLDGNGLAEGDYKGGSIIFEGSGGVKTVQVTSKVAKPPTITSAGDRGGSYVDVDPPKTPCNGPWRVKARVEDSSKVTSVSVSVSVGPAAGNSFGMTRESGDERAGIWVLGNQGQLTPGSGIKLTFKAVDELGAEASPAPYEEIDGQANSFDCTP